MKIESSTLSRRAGMMMLVLGAIAAAPSAFAAAPPINGTIDTRPLTPTDISSYGLTGNMGANGLTTVPIKQPVYLEALINIAIPDSNITSVVWTLTNAPVGSAATLTTSPL